MKKRINPWVHEYKRRHRHKVRAMKALGFLTLTVQKLLVCARVIADLCMALESLVRAQKEKEKQKEVQDGREHESDGNQRD